MNNQEEYPDLHHKMSKKIAQLTRVIFHLNTKNDEYEYNLRAIVGAYENELDNLVREANSTILKYKETVTKMQKNDELENQMKNFQDKIDIEKAKSITEFSNYKKMMEDREFKFLKESNTRLDTYKSEVEMLRNKYDGMLKNVEKLLNNNTDMSKAHKKEMADYVTEQNQKFNELLKQKLDLEDLLKDRQKMLDMLKKEQDKLLEKNNQELRTQKSLSDKGLNDLKNGYEKRINELEIQKNNLEIRIKEMEINEKEYKRKILELQSELNARIRELEGNVQNANSKGANLLKNITILEDENSKYKSDLANERNKVYMLEAKNKQLEDKLHGIDAEKQGIVKELQRLREKFDRTDSEKNSENEGLKRQIEGLMKEITNLNTSNKTLTDSYENELKKKDKEIENLRYTMEGLEKSVMDLKTLQKKSLFEHNEEIKRLQDIFSNEKRKIYEELEQKITSMSFQKDVEIKEILDEYERKIADIKEEYEKKMSFINQQNEKELKKLRQEYENTTQAKSNRENALTKEINSLKVDLEKALTELQTFKKANEILTQDELALEKQVKKLEEELEQLHITLRDLQKENDSLKSSGIEELQKLLSDNERLKKELEDQVLQYQQKLYKEKSEYESTIKSTLKHLKEDHLFELRRLKEDYELEKSMLETEKNKKIRELENELGNEKKRHMEDNTEWAIKIDTLTKDYENALNNLRELKINELNEKDREYQALIEKLRKTHEDEMKKLDQRKEEEKQENLKDLFEKKNLELEESKKLFEKKYQRLSKSFDNQLQEKLKEWESKLQAKEEKLAIEMKAHHDTKNEYLKFKDEAENKIKGLEEMVKNLRKFQEGLQDEISELKEEILKIKSDHEYELENSNKEKNKIMQKSQEKELELKDRLKVELANQLKSHIKFIEDLKIEYHEMEHLGQEKFRELNDKYEDLKILFDQRPSRIEDIETIKMLKKEIMVREDEIKKLHEHMKFFKLELINREQNYNKIFNANPHIGVLNPLENKTSFVTNNANSTNNPNSNPSSSNGAHLQRLGSSGPGGIAGSGIAVNNPSSNQIINANAKSFKSVNKI